MFILNSQGDQAAPIVPEYAEYRDITDEFNPPTLDVNTLYTLGNLFNILASLIAGVLVDIFGMSVSSIGAVGIALCW